MHDIVDILTYTICNAVIAVARLLGCSHIFIYTYIHAEILLKLNIKHKRICVGLCAIIYIMNIYEREKCVRRKMIKASPHGLITFFK